MHVHTIHSGMCTVPILRHFCRESYTEPEELYEHLKRSGMDLVTVTDHDSIDAVESLCRHPDFFLSEEVTCRMPSGTQIHVGVYDITERQHVGIQRRRGDFEALTAYLNEQNRFYTINHVFSRLTGRRDPFDFVLFETHFPGFEALNGHMLPEANRRSADLAARLGKAFVGGSDAHTLASAGKAWTEVATARNKDDFVAAVRRGAARVGGEAGGYLKLTADICRIAAAMMRDLPTTVLLTPLAPALPVVTAINYFLEASFAWRWPRRIGQCRTSEDFDATAASSEAA